MQLRLDRRVAQMLEDKSVSMAITERRKDRATCLDDRRREVRVAVRRYDESKVHQPAEEDLVYNTRHMTS